jgi:serine/threonine protein kinase
VVPDVTESATPTAFGPFELCRELASGGMASVWLAVRRGDGDFARTCAIKRVHPHLAKVEAFVEMFLDEARIAARIDHPNVCQVFDYGNVDGTPFIAMEYLAGVPLSMLPRRLSDGGADAAILAGVCSLVAEAADGLHAAHELIADDGKSMDVVHRDISPQNLFLTFDGVVKVVDFGIASARDKVHETETGQVKGKFAYMAPEQMRGKKVDRRADVWSLGVVLWELLAGRRLFRRATQAETMDAVLRAQFTPPSHINDAVPAALDLVVQSALAVDPEARCGSMSELAASLRNALREPLWDRRRRETWVNELFPEEKTTSSRRLKLALATSAKRTTSASSQPNQSAATPDRPDRPDRSEETRDERPPLPTGRRPALMLAIAGASLLAVLGVGAVVFSGTETDAETLDAAPAFNTQGESSALPVAAPSSTPVHVPVSLDGDEDQGDSESAPEDSESGVDEQPEAIQAPRTRMNPRRTPASTMTAPIEPAVADEPSAAEPGCIRLGLGVRARIGADVIEGPRTLQVPAGRVLVTLLGDPPEQRTLMVAAGRDCQRLTR